MSESNQLVTGSFQYTPFAIRPEVLQARENALAASALIGKVETAQQNEASAAARRTIKGLLSLFETQRKKLKEPILECGRQLDRAVDAERQELKREDARLENLEKDFIRAELRRRAEEEELQRKELARIEAERQAEIDRIAREQAEAERKAREAAAEAAGLANEATNKQQREAAEAARLEAQRQSDAAAEQARLQAQLANEKASQAAYLESKPPEISRAKGQSVKKVWVIEQINDFQLMKARPDLVRKVEWDVTGIKQALADGQKLPGVVAREDIGVGSRGGRVPDMIEV